LTHNAREVLADCHLALQMLEEEQNPQRWRIHWAAGVALVRAVGHVLNKVDGQDPIIRETANRRYKFWNGTSPAHRIFREFIERERNNLLKEYQINVHPFDEISVLVQAVLRPVAGGDPVTTAEVLNLEDNVYRPLINGPWEGEDARDVLAEATKWWERQLDLIDKIAANARHPKPHRKKRRSRRSSAREKK